MNAAQAEIVANADADWLETIARGHAGMHGPDSRDPIECAALLLSMVMLDAARTTQAAIREAAEKIAAAILDTGTENAGAIDSMGTDVGAGLAELREDLGAAVKAFLCQPGT